MTSDLEPVSVVMHRYCVHCGRRFPIYADYQTQRERRLTCSPRCHVARWRAIGMLEGTLVRVDGKYRRVR